MYVFLLLLMRMVIWTGLMTSAEAFDDGTFSAILDLKGETSPGTRDKLTSPLRGHFGSESDYVPLFVTPSRGTPKSDNPVANPRKLLIDDGLNEDNVLQRLSERRKKDESLSWRMKDLSLLEEIAGFMGPHLTDPEEGLAREELLEGVVRRADFSPDLLAQQELHKRQSNVYEVLAQPLGTKGSRCQEGEGECSSGDNNTMTLRERLQKDLATSYTEPLASFIQYRLKRKPSIYMSKKPQVKNGGIGIPDIYETEVEVTPMSPSTLRRSTSKTKKKEKETTSDTKVVKYSSSPKFVSLSSLYNFREDSLAKQNPPQTQGDVKKPEEHQILSRGSVGVQANPRGEGLRKHLPFRRPISFKYKRTGDTQLNGGSDSGNETKPLSALERITLNKTPGIVIEHPNIFLQDSFVTLPPSYSRRPQRKKKRPTRIHPDKRRQKKPKQKKPKTNANAPVSYPKSHIGYEIPDINLRVPTHEYFPPKETVHPTAIYVNRENNDHSIPIRGHSLDDEDDSSYEIPSQKYDSPAKDSGPYTITYKHKAEEEQVYSAPDSGPEEYPKRGKGEVPRWLMTLKKEKPSPTPYPSRFPEASTVRWVPMESDRDKGPTFMMPKDKYAAPHASESYGPSPSGKPDSDSYEVHSHSYELPDKKYSIPDKDNPITEYLPPDQLHPVHAEINQNSRKEYGKQSQPPPPQIHEPLDLSILSDTTPVLHPHHEPDSSGYLPPTKNKTSTKYSTPRRPTTRPKYNTKVTTSKPSKRPQIIYINDDVYYDYDDYLDDEYYDDEYYYDDDEYDDDYDDDDYYDDDVDVYEIITKGERPFMPHIVMADLDDILHEVDIMEYGYILGIPGIAGRDYPILQYIPLTTFRCHLVADYPGYYADMEAGCQVFHVCHRSGRQDSFLCPNGTIFNQKYFVCDWWYNFDCQDAVFFYPVNAAIEFQEVPLHEYHLEEGYSFTPSTPKKASKPTSYTAAGRRRRRKTSKKSGNGARPRRVRRPHSRKGQRRIEKYS